MCNHVLIIPSGYPTAHSPVRGSFYRNQAYALHKAGWKVGVVYPDLRSLQQITLKAVIESHFQISYQVDHGVTTCLMHGWNLGIVRFRPMLFLAQAIYLANAYISKFGRPDIIHAHSICGGIAANAISKRLGIPYVITEHSTDFARGLIEDWQVKDIKSAYNNSSSVVAVSNPLAKIIQPYVDKPVKVIPNLINVDFFSLPEKPRTAVRFNFLALALLTPKKGLDVLIRSFAEAFREIENVFLEIGGDGPQRAELEELARDQKIASKVKFLGLLNPHEVREAMWRSNAFVLSSYVETFGVVCIEAMSTGLPVIATRCGGPEDFIDKNVGQVIEPGDTSSLASAMRIMVTNSNYYNYNEIRKYTVSRFSERAVANNLIELYEAVCRS